MDYIISLKITQGKSFIKEGNEWFEKTGETNQFGGFTIKTEEQLKLFMETINSFDKTPNIK